MEQSMSGQFDNLDAIEKAAVKGALNRCRALAAQIESELRNKRPEHFVDKLSLADFYASLEHAAEVIGQKGQRSVDNTPAPLVKIRRCRTLSDNRERNSSAHVPTSVVRTSREPKRQTQDITEALPPTRHSPRTLPQKARHRLDL
jgi:hypothetical protein